MPALDRAPAAAAAVAQASLAGAGGWPRLSLSLHGAGAGLRARPQAQVKAQAQGQGQVQAQPAASASAPPLHALDGGGGPNVPLPAGLVFGLALSRLLGWTYTLCWGVSFVPQIVHNARRRAVTGLSIDFLALNLFGHACYAAFNLAFLTSEQVRSEYRERHGGAENVVRWNDAAFSCWATLCAFVQLSQVFIYGRSRTQRISFFNLSVLFVLATALLVAVLLCSLGGENRLQWLDVAQLLGGIKLWISVLKYVPQARLNAARRSTRGFSIENILLDAAGGALSLAQLLLDAGLSGDWSAVTGDAAKLGLALISLAMDAVFIVQHYVLYGPQKNDLVKQQEREAGILEDDEDAQEDEDAPAERPPQAAAQAPTERTPLLPAQREAGA